MEMKAYLVEKLIHYLIMVYILVYHILGMNGKVWQRDLILNVVNRNWTCYPLFLALVDPADRGTEFSE